MVNAFIMVGCNTNVLPFWCSHFHLKEPHYIALVTQITKIMHGCSALWSFEASFSEHIGKCPVGFSLVGAEADPMKNSSFFCFIMQGDY